MKMMKKKVTLPTGIKMKYFIKLVEKWKKRNL